MLVSELKQILKNVPDDADVVMQIGDNRLMAIAQVHTTRVIGKSKRIILTNHKPIKDRRG